MRGSEGREEEGRCNIGMGKEMEGRGMWLVMILCVCVCFVFFLLYYPVWIQTDRQTDR